MRRRPRKPIGAHCSLRTIYSVTSIANTPLAVVAAGRPVASEQTRQLDDSDLPDRRRASMKPLFDLIVRTVMLNTTHAINLYRLGGMTGLLLGTMALVLTSRTRR